MSADFIAAIDIILRRLRNNCMYLGVVAIISTLDHTQIQSFDGRPFLTSSNIIPTFKMIAIQHLVRVADDPSFFGFNKYFVLIIVPWNKIQIILLN